MESNAYGKNIQTFATAADFYKIEGEIALTTPIYVDSNLGNGIRGEEVTQRLSQIGFQTLYLATGYQKERFPAMPWLKGIYGKDAPWRNG